jgi:hypothetical protein
VGLQQQLVVFKLVLQQVLYVGSSFIKNNAVGLGVTTTTGRNAGVSTATGSLIYNSNAAKVQVYNGTEWVNVGDEQYIEATGGTISDYWCFTCK